MSEPGHNRIKRSQLSLCTIFASCVCVFECLTESGVGACIKIANLHQTDTNPIAQRAQQAKHRSASTVAFVVSSSATLPGSDDDHHNVDGGAEPTPTHTTSRHHGGCADASAREVFAALITSVCVAQTGPGWVLTPLPLSQLARARHK